METTSSDRNAVLFGVAMLLLVPVAGCSGCARDYWIEAKNDSGAEIYECALMFDDDPAKVFKFGVVGKDAHKGAFGPFPRLSSLQTMTLSWQRADGAGLEQRIDVPGAIATGLNPSAKKYVLRIDAAGTVGISSEP